MKKKIISLILVLSIVGACSVPVFSAEEFAEEEFVEEELFEIEEDEREFFEEFEYDFDMDTTETVFFESEELVEDEEIQEKMEEYELLDDEMDAYDFAGDDMEWDIEPMEIDMYEEYELEEVDEEVENALCAYDSMICAVEAHDIDAVRDALLGFKEAEALLTEEQKADLDDAAIDYADEIYELDLLLKLIDAYGVYVPESSRNRAVEFITAYETYFGNCENSVIRTLLDDFSNIEGLYEEVKDASSYVDVSSVYLAYTSVVNALEECTFEAFEEGVNEFYKFVDLFNLIYEDSLYNSEREQLAYLMGAESTEEAFYTVLYDWINVNILYDFGIVYYAFDANEDMESAESFVEKYDGIFNSPEYTDEYLKEYVMSAYANIDAMYTAAKEMIEDNSEKQESIVPEESAGDEEAVNMVPSNSVTLETASSNVIIKTAVETSDNSSVWMSILSIFVSLFIVVFCGRKKFA